MKGRSRKRTGIWFALIALCLFSVFPLVTRAQANQYSFSALSETYTPITGGTVLNASIPDSWQSGQVALSPGFTFNGVTYTYAYITSNGLISLGGTAGPGTSEYNGIANNGNGSGIHLCPFNADLNGAATGTPEIRFETVGNEHVFQWQDARRYNIGTERISFQVRLNTATGEIKFVYGGTINAGAGTSYQPVVGIRTSATGYKNISIGTGADTWAAPSAGTGTGNTCRFTSDAPAKSPVVGQAYLFTPPPPCSGTPVAGTLAPLTQNLCNGATPAAIVATGYTNGFTGLSLQWEESNDDGATDAWANAVGGTGATTGSYTPPAFTGTPIYYRLKVTCANGGASATSASSLVSGPTSPATAASAVAFTNVNPGSMTIGWTSGNGTRRFAVINTTNTFTDPVNGATGPGTVNAVYGGSGQQVVYDGTGTSVDVSGLACNTTYFVRVYEYNRCGTSPSFTYYYNTTSSGTNPLSQATPNLPAAVNIPVNNNFTGFTGANLATVFPGWREAAIVTAAGSAPGQTNPTGITSVWTNSTALTGTTAKVNLYTNTRNEWIISPKINVTAPVTLEFKAAITDAGSGSADAAGMQGTDDKVNVLISTDPCGSSWTNIYTFDASNTTTLTNSLRQFTFYLGAPYVGQTVQIAFQATDGPTDNTPDYDFHIGDIKITQTPTCVLPTALTASNITTGSATLTWAAPAAGGSPVSYLWKVVASGAGSNGTAVASGSVNSPAVTTPVTGLSANTSYDAYVRTNCGSGDTSVWSAVVSFSTPCAATNVPYVQDFESVTTPALPNCTSNQNVGAGNNWVTSSPAGNGFTSKNLTYVFNSTNPANVWFYIQGLNLTGNVTYRLTYRYGNNGGATYVEKLKVAYGSSALATAMTNPLADHPNITNSTASITNTVDFTPATSGVYYIGFQCYSATDRNRLFVDDIRVELAPTCFPPTAPVVSGIGTNTATLAWTAPTQGTPSTYLWKVVAAGAAVTTPAVASGSVAAPALTTGMTGLAPGINYDVYMRSVCGAGDTSAWSTSATFLTLCNSFNTFPFTETFETNSPSRNCWTQIQVAGTASWTYAAGSSAGAITTAQQGSLNARFVSVTGTNTPITKLVSPVFDLSAISNPRVSFYLGQQVNSGSQNTTKLYYRISATDPWVEIGNYTTNLNAWTQFTVALPNPSATYQIAFEGINNNGRANVVDNIVVERTPTCYPPTALVVSNVGISTADLAWTAPAQGTPSTYLWKVVAAGGNVNGAALASGSVAAPAVTTTMTGLPSATAFDVYIRSVCGAGDTSAWSVKATSTTLCDIANVPYTLDFETAVVPALPLCTSRENAGTGNNWTTDAPATSGFFSQTLRYRYNGSNPANAWFYTKAVNLTGGVSYRLSYRYGCGDADYAEKMKVYYGTTAASASMTNVLADHPSITNDITPIINTLDFTPATTGVYYIAFQCYSPTNYYMLYVDDIHVDFTPSCTPPTNLVISNVGSSSATLTWTAPVIGTPANYMWKAVAAGAGSNGAALASGTVAAPALTTTMTGLPVATAFDVYMRTDCGGADTSAWSAPKSSATGQIPVSTYPYDQGFESGLDSWQAGNGTEPNKWVVGTATNNGGTQALYISNDNGVSNAYTTGTSSVTHVYRDFQIPAGFPLISLQFDWKAAGETPAYDRMRVYVAPVSFTPTPGTQITAAGTAPTGIVRLGAEFNNQSTFIVFNNILSPAYENQSFRLIFEWRNDGGTGTQPPAALDNIHVELSSCAPPNTLTGTATHNSASLGWTQPGTATQWDVEYGPAGFTQGTGTQINDTTANPLTISGLAPTTSYSYYVRANCGGPESPWAGPFTFTTLCQPADLLSTTPATRCGEGTVTLAATTTPGARINWYASATATTPLDTGNTYTTPVINTSTTYYVATSAGAAPLHVGPANNMGALDYTSLTDWGITFNVTQPTTIRSIAVYPQGAGTFTVSVQSGVGSGATVFGTYTATITAAQAGTKVIVPINVTIPTAGTGYKMLLKNYTGLGSGLHRDNPIPSGFSFPFTAPGSPITLTSSEWGGTTTANYYFFYDWEVDGSCYGPRTPVVATVTTPPAITPTVNDTEICAGETVNLNVTSANTGYTYTWTPGNLSGAAQSVTPSTTTRYRVRAVDNSGGANDGCVVSDSSVTVTVIPLPPSPNVTPATASLCLGSSQTLSAASVGLPTPIFSENFEGASHAFTAVNTSTGTNPANADWTVRNDGYVYNGTTAVTFHSPDNSKFILSNSDAIGSGAATNTILTSPVINTTGYTGLSLKFDHTTRIFGSNPHSKVEVSTNGGTSWTTLADYTTDLGTSSGFVSQTINLDTYINNPNFRFRFAYTAAWSWYWAIDNVVLSGNQPLSTSWVATPATDAGLPAGAGTPSTSNGTISVTPTATGAYVYTAITQTPQGCLSQPSSSVVTVNPLPTVDAGPTQNVCPRTPITLSGSGAATYTWDNGVTNGVAFPAPTATTLYTVTGRDANNCSSTDTVTVIAKPTTPASITADGALTYCANQTRTLTAVGGGTGPYTYAWTPGGQTTQTIQPTATGTYTVTITEAGVCSGQASSSVTVNPVVTTTLNRTICSNQTYTLVDNTVVNTAGTYTKTTTASTGCDSIVTVVLTVNPTRTSNISVNLCQGGSYTLVDGTVINSAGTYTATTNNSSTGCDSTVTAVVTVRPTYNTPVTARICQGQTYTLANGTSVNTAGVHTVTVPSVSGCDSTVAVTLTVIAPITRTATASICSGNSYTLPSGTQVTTAGVYTSTLTSGVTGCDSIIVTTLTVNPSPNLNLGADITAVSPPVLLNAGSGFTSYLWNTGATTQSITVNTAGTYSVTVKNQFNCTATDTVKVTFTASIVNLGDNGGSISLFPNPTSDRFTLNVYGYTGGGKMVFDVINAVGQVVRTEAIGNATENFTKEMEISTLASGTYTLRVRGTNATANLRFVIAR